jgi:hypothetical protein
MPVEDRLRQGLEANATSFSPHGEWRLERVHLRRRRRTRAVAGSVAAATVVLGAVLVQAVPSWSPGSTAPAAGDCSSVEGHTAPEEDTMDKRTIVAAAAVAALASACDPAGGAGRTAPPGDSSPSPSASSTSDALVPARGGFGREVTVDQGVALGLPRRTVERLVGDDGVLPLGLRFQQGIFTLWVNDDDFEPTAHDFGTYAVEPGGRLVLTSTSDRCPGCTTTLSWQWDGADAVVVDSVERETAGRMARYLWEGRWSYNRPQ